MPQDAKCGREKFYIIKEIDFSLAVIQLKKRSVFSLLFFYVFYVFRYCKIHGYSQPQRYLL